MDSIDAVIAHDFELAAHGGSIGIRDQDMLESALARPRNLWVYSEKSASWAALAAAYAFGISSDHLFVDGNERTALVVSFAFLETNGRRVIAGQEDAYQTFYALATGEVDERELTDWFESSTRPFPG